MQIVRWQETTAPLAQVLSDKMKLEGLSPYSWSNGPGESYAVHSHNYEKVLYCVSGSIRFTLPDHIDASGKTLSIELHPGDCLILPAGTRHSAFVGAQGVICLEAPRR